MKFQVGAVLFLAGLVLVVESYEHHHHKVVHSKVDIHNLEVESVPIPQPYPVHVEQHVAAPYPVAVKVPVEQPYPVQVTHTVPYVVKQPVLVEKKVPVFVKEHGGYANHHSFH